LFHSTHAAVSGMPPQSKYERRSGTAQQARTSVSSRRGFYQIAGGLWAQ
jgi:hypothetical protein